VADTGIVEPDRPVLDVDVVPDAATTGEYCQCSMRTPPLITKAYPYFSRWWRSVDSAGLGFERMASKAFRVFPGALVHRSRQPLTVAVSA